MSKINFVGEFRAIMETCRRESLPARARLLWIALFYLANDRATENEQDETWEWPDDFFSVNNAELITHCPLEKRAMLEARNRLKQLGYIDFRAGDNATKPAKYRIHYLTGGQWCKNAPQGVPQQVPQGVPQQVPQGAPQPVPYYININNNQNENNTHDQFNIDNARARDRLSETYTTETGREERCRFDNGFLVSARARGAVAQRILGQFFGDIDVDNSHATLCQMLEDGMPPEVAEDCVEDFRSMSEYLGHLRKIYRAGRYAEKRDALEMAKLKRLVKNDKAAEYLFRQSDRYQQRYGMGD